MWQDRKNVNTALQCVAILTHSTHGCARTRARSLTFMSLLKITELVEDGYQWQGFRRLASCVLRGDWRVRSTKQPRVVGANVSPTHLVEGAAQARVVARHIVDDRLARIRR